MAWAALLAVPIVLESTSPTSWNGVPLGETWVRIERLVNAGDTAQTVTGIKSLLLKVVDPLFRRKGGGSAIPIKIEGTRADPKFGLDMGRVFKKGD